MGNLLFSVMPEGRVTGQQADGRTMEEVSAESQQSIRQHVRPSSVCVWARARAWR